jgi:hypothetical protein
MKSSVEAHRMLALFIMLFLMLAPLFGFAAAKILIKIKRSL